MQIGTRSFPKVGGPGWTSLSFIATTLFISACGVGDTSVDGPSAPVTAKGGGGGSGGGTTEVQVTGANPNRAPQDTTLTVAIFGSGFGTGARAVWSLNGDTTQVLVKSTKVVNSTQVNATIEVPLTATVATYSIVVVMPGGKKGVGAELFAIDEKNPTPDFEMDTDASLGIRPDSYSNVYRMGVCGVHTRIFAFEASLSGDAIMDTQNARYSDRKCKSYPRKLVVDYGDDVTGSATIINVNKLSSTLVAIPIGASEKRGMNISDSRCGGLRYKRTLVDGTEVEGDSVVVTRLSHTTWVVETQAAPNNRAYCLGLDRSFSISARFTIISEKPLP